MARPNSARMRQIKRALARRDGSCCFYCACPFADLRLATVDHLIPQSLMPGWRLVNLVLACRPCNQAKADTLPQVFLRPSPYRSGLRPRPWLASVLDRLAAVVTRWADRPRLIFVPGGPYSLASGNTLPVIGPFVGAGLVGPVHV